MGDLKSLSVFFYWFRLIYILKTYRIVMLAYLQDVFAKMMPNASASLNLKMYVLYYVSAN